MAKELPYFQFEPAEYLTKDISFCSLSAQGLFINICSYYWQRNCQLTKKQLLKRLNYEVELNELIDEGIIDFENESVVIKFLDNQLSKVIDTIKINSVNGSKGGAPKGNNNAKKQANNNPKTTEKQGIREEKIREYKKKVENIINNDFLIESLGSIQWMEVCAMQNQVSEDVIKIFLTHFSDHLIVMDEQKKSTNEFKKHFINWLGKQDLSQHRRKVIGKTNQ